MNQGFQTGTEEDLGSKMEGQRTEFSYLVIYNAIWDPCDLLNCVRKLYTPNFYTLKEVSVQYLYRRDIGSPYRRQRRSSTSGNDFTTFSYEDCHQVSR